MRGASPRNPLQVCLVVQNCLAEAFLRRILVKQPQICVFGLKQYLGLPAHQKKDTVFVVDAPGLEMPLNEWLRHLRTYCSNPKFLVLDQGKSTEQIVRFLVMGVHGYLPDSDVSRMLCRAVYSVAANQFWVPPEVFHEFLRQAASALRKDDQSPHRVTPREEEILELIRKRLSNKEIAHLLRIRVSTVKFHVSNILSKMQASKRRDLIEAASDRLWRMLVT
jgi:DNA-binding NarL/FixJ family response regulator